MLKQMDYSKAKEWILREQAFDSAFLGKCEAVMSLGNGYMGLRSATEERYVGEKRDLFVAGTFNRFDENEVTELPNAADVLAMDLSINGELFHLNHGTVRSYERELHIKTGELIRNIVWVSPKGDEVVLSFRRIVSMDNLHLIAQLLEITPVHDVEIKLVTGIDGSMSNSGSQHFSEGDKRLFDQTYMQYNQTTTETKIAFVFHSGVKFTNPGGKDPFMNQRIVMDRRKIQMEYWGLAEGGKTLRIEKLTDVRTTRDKEAIDKDLEMLKQEGLQAVKQAYDCGYEKLAAESAKAWVCKVWDQTPICIDSEDELDELAIHFAQYHLYIMTPAHDNRMNIGAKGLSGEGYKGHTFWDTDIFALPYFTFTDPKIARSLLEYRYLSLPGAHAKAKGNGYRGAQFPWESAWLYDGEVTPVWGAADIITGLPTKIWSGFIEQHITSDVVYGIWQYYMVTGDQDFMDKYGYEVMMDTARFWNDRLEYSEVDGLYHINDVIGPDEYKEHADDNAFTNYMAHWNIKKAMEYYHILKKEKPEIFKTLDDKLELRIFYPLWEDKCEKIYLPKPREDDLLVAQDAKYLTLDHIDLSKYKNRDQVGTMFHDYNLEQVNQLQVSKQADVMILFLLMEDLFSLDVKKANWDYYEPRTLHDSSLSLSTHCILASDMEEKDLAYRLFQRARCIDMGDNMKSSNDGIHSAALAGIWQSVVYGFGGVRMLNGVLRINPHLPEKWSHLEFEISWQGERILVVLTHTSMKLQNLTGSKTITFQHNGKEYELKDTLEL